MKLNYVLVIVAVFSPSFTYGSLDLLSDEFIDFINSQGSTWKAGRNFEIETPLQTLLGLTGVLSDHKLHRLPEVAKVVDEAIIPESFDARENWPECSDIIGIINDQANCAACWAFGAVEAMSDRLCIHSMGQVKVIVSIQDLLSCCADCGYGCWGGTPGTAWQRWVQRGIVTGGGYNSTNGCKAYSVAPCKPSCQDDAPTPECICACDDGSSSELARTFGKSSYSLPNDQRQIQLEIMENGPVEGVFTIYSDFLHYKSGVYQHLNGTSILGSHAIKILGWGVEQDVPYWLAANSWNSDWGDKGYFKILRGCNESDIEADIVTGLPKLDKNY